MNEWITNDDNNNYSMIFFIFLFFQIFVIFQYHSQENLTIFKL
jgi:hypothetical protein